MSIADDVTYHEVLKTELKKDINSLKPKREIDEIKMAMEALHTNLYCSEVEVLVDGYSAELEGTLCIFDYASRDALIKKRIQAEREKRINDPNDGTLDENEESKDQNGIVKKKINETMDE